jgi:hypothetical protein
VYGLLRTFAGERLLLLANFTADEQSIRASLPDEHRLGLDPRAAEPDGRAMRSDDGEIHLAPYQFLWISG